MKVFSHLGLAIALLSAGSMVIAPQSAMAQKEKKEKKKKKKKKSKKESAPKLSLSSGYSASYAPNTQLISAGDAETVKFGLPDLEALIANESDSFAHGSITFDVGRSLNDRDLQLAGIERMVNSQFLPPQNKPIFVFLQGSYAFDRKDDALAITKLSESYNLGYRGNNIELLLGYAHSRSKLAQPAIDWFEKALIDGTARGEQVDEENALNNMALAAIRSKDSVLIDGTFKRILPRSNASSIWHDGLSQLMNNNNFNDDENLDILRLMRTKEVILYTQEYASYVQAADPRRLPNEVAEIISEGRTKGHIEKQDISFSDNYNLAKERIPADKADLASAARDAQNAANGKTASATADAYLSYNDYQKAIDLYTIALEKGGADKDRVLTRLGIAQTKSGDLTGARTSFSAIVSPNRKSIASYWLIYVDTLEKPNKAAAPAPAA